MTMTMLNIELTDTFGGEANYSWVRRAQIEEAKTKVGTIRRAKKALGISDVRTRTIDHGDALKLEFPRSHCLVAFITWMY
jgi:hypothetical protein